MPATAAWRRRLGVAVPVTTAVALGVTTLGTAPAADAGKARKLRHAARVAINQIGDPYVYGATGPGSFDCSGLTAYSYHKSNLRLPRTSSSQARYARRIRKGRLRRGDLMFFYSGSGVYHVGMFLKWNRAGRAVMVHSPNSGDHVRRAVPWTKSWFAGTLR